jgi:hypothetical protein
MLLQLGFHASQADVSLFIFNQAGIQIYVLISWYSNAFAVKDLGQLNYFLGVEVHHTSAGLILTQHKYIRDLLLRTNMDSSNGVSTPMLPTDKLSLHGGDSLPSDDTTKYRSIMGALQYLSFTRPDISFFMNRVCYTSDFWHPLLSIGLLSKVYCDI